MGFYEFQCGFLATICASLKLAEHYISRQSGAGGTATASARDGAARVSTARRETSMLHWLSDVRSGFALSLSALTAVCRASARIGVVGSRCLNRKQGAGSVIIALRGHGAR